MLQCGAGMSSSRCLVQPQGRPLWLATWRPWPRSALLPRDSGILRTWSSSLHAVHVLRAPGVPSKKITYVVHKGRTTLSLKLQQHDALKSEVWNVLRLIRGIGRCLPTMNFTALHSTVLTKSMSESHPTAARDMIKTVLNNQQDEQTASNIIVPMRAARKDAQSLAAELRGTTWKLRHICLSRYGLHTATFCGDLNKTDNGTETRPSCLPIQILWLGRTLDACNSYPRQAILPLLDFTCSHLPEADDASQSRTHERLQRGFRNGLQGDSALPIQAVRPPICPPHKRLSGVSNRKRPGLFTLEDIL
jgi:hypothetical protein